MVRPGLPQLLRLRPLAVPRRRRPQVVRSTCCGTTYRSVGGSPKHPPSTASCCRNTTPSPAALTGADQNIFAGSPAWPRRGPASLQARRLVLPDHRRGRHRLRPCRHHGPLAQPRRPLRAPPRTPSCSPPRTPPTRPLQRAGHGQIVETPDGVLPHPPLRRAAPRHPPLAARPRDRDPALRLGRRRLAPPRPRWARPAPSRSRRRPAPPTPSPNRAGDTASTAPPLPNDFQWLRTPYPERIFAADRRPGVCACIAREIDRQLVRAGAGRPPPAALLACAPRPTLDFAPDTYQQAAGLTHYYNRYKFHFLAVSYDAGSAGCSPSCPVGATGPTAASPSRSRRRCRCRHGPVGLAAEVAGPAAFSAGPAATGRHRPGARRHGYLRRGRPRRARLFTGAFVGMVAFDTSGRAAPPTSLASPTPRSDRSREIRRGAGRPAHGLFRPSVASACLRH